MKVRARRPLGSTFSSLIAAISCSLFLLVAGCGSVHPGTGGGGSSSPTVTIAASPTSVAAGASSTLTVAATNATTVKVTGNDGSSKTWPRPAAQCPSRPPRRRSIPRPRPAPRDDYHDSHRDSNRDRHGPNGKPTVTVTADPATITAGSASTLTIAATNATA